MTSPQIVLVTKQQMLLWEKFPYFGLALYPENRILIRSDLPRCVQTSVLAHEQSHLARGDQESFWKNEPPAWWAGFKAQPLGFFLGVILSLTPERIGLYLQRLRGNR